MKRGLKVPLERGAELAQHRYNRYPDEKGTERINVTAFGANPLRYNRYPDEKGTESNVDAASCRSDYYSYNRYPDEKGTESR